MCQSSDRICPGRPGCRPRWHPRDQENGVYAIVAQAHWVICVVLVNGELMGGWIKALQSRAIRPNPQRSLVIFLDVDVDLRCVFLFGFVYRKTRSRRIEKIQTIVGRGPQPACLIDQQPHHIIVAYAELIHQAVSERLVPSCSRVETEQSLAVATKPKKT